jgi:hypothetical protein
VKKRKFFYAALIALASACAGSSDSTPAGGTPSVFVAFGENFRGYHSWKSYDVTGDAGLAGIHDGSTVTEYLNEVPGSGLTAFPVGTIIVKEATGGTVGHEIFAMVKRGGGFNSGAPGWEWFDIQNLNDGQDGAKILWRGYSAPTNSTYGGDVNGSCNTCHDKCGNDAVCAKPLALSNF